MSRRTILCIACLSAFSAGGWARADEGMWVFNNLPLDTLQSRHGFQPPPGWVEHLQASAVRFNNGGSGSFVSADGLIMTNHHVGSDALAKLGTAERDIYRDGYLAKSRSEELKTPDLELNVLVSIEDVTDQVNAAIKPDTDPAEASVLRRQAIAGIEQKSLEETGLRSDVVTLYQGGQYHLYRYKKYTDVRLVFAPEFDIAFFGGDEDNFEYPRYDLDVCFFRAYENDAPAQVEHFLSWSPDGSRDGDLVFVAGHPGRTSRLNTLASLEYLRDHALPRTMKYINSLEAFLIDYGKKGDEQLRQSKEDLFGIQNSRKAYLGRQGGLENPEFMKSKKDAEEALRAAIAADPVKRQAYAEAWERIEQAQATAAELAMTYTMLEQGRAFNSQYFQTARTLVRMAAELAKPNADRLREYGEAGLESLRFRLFADTPIFDEFEQAKLAPSQGFWAQAMPDDPLVQKVLRGRDPATVASELVSGTKLGDVAYRKQLAEGGMDAITASEDPMIKLALAVDAEARAIRKQREDKVESVETAEYARIAKAIFEQLGDSVYPDATFTLRLAFGTVKGYEIDSQFVPPYTTFGGAFDHERLHNAAPPYKLPESWHKAKDEGRLPLETPFNFVSTADIIGGNSGSPVVNREGQVVGLIFDGNIQSLVLDFGYEDVVSRAVSVDSRAIATALKTVYQADALYKELTGGK